LRREAPRSVARQDVALLLSPLTTPVLPLI
jgi:hypothetical protein